MKVVINRCYGGFSLSEEAYKYLDLPWDGYGYAFDSTIEDRSNPRLIACVEALGEKANGSCAELKVVEVPDGIDVYIHNYDGMESVREVHSSWY